MDNDYQRDGVAVLRGFLNDIDILTLRMAIQSAVHNKSAMSRNLAENGSTFFNDFNTWRKNPYIKLMAESLAPMLAEATGNTSLRLFHDHVIVKTGMSPETPWHQDRPYYLVEGDNNFTIWMSPDPVDHTEGVRFLPGSHLSGEMFVPVNFKDGAPLGEGMSVLTEEWIDDWRDEHGEMSFYLNPGDAVIFDNRIIHRAVRSDQPVPRSSLSIRYLGDGATMTWNGVNQTPPFHKMGLQFAEGDEPNEAWFPTVYP